MPMVKQLKNNASKKKSRRINLIPVFIGIILFFGLVIFIWWYRATSLHRDLEKNGFVTTAYVNYVHLYYASSGRYHSDRYPVTDPEQATDLYISVSYVIGHQTYHEIISSTFSEKNNDHVEVYDEAKTGHLKVKYLPNDPTKVKPLLEFTDSNNNPYFGGR
jgi:predicted permease